MPIPPPERYHRSNLTKKQQQEQLAACYGVPMASEQLTEVEISRMRQILAQHDSEHKPMQTIDLNNPPRVPYKYQKFPMMLYDLVNSHPARDEEQPRRNGPGFDTIHIPAKVITLLVNSETQLKKAIEEGWSDQAPNFSEEQEFPLSAKYQNEASRVQEQIDATKRRAGRPSNAELERRRQEAAV